MVPQKQCAWCGELGPRYCTDPESVHYTGDAPIPVGDHVCVCPHPNAANRMHALRVGGRYFSPERKEWVCPSCGTDAPATEAEAGLLGLPLREAAGTL